jgi:phosphatidylethanolamine-binding protein (PEBP) family uncharacterized protein
MRYILCLLRADALSIAETIAHLFLKNIHSPSLYTLISIDPDAPSRWNQVASPWRHAVIEGLLPRSSAELAVTGAEHDPFKAVQMTRENVITPWLGPAPPVATGDHRYMFLLYRETKVMKPIEEQSTVSTILQNLCSEMHSFITTNY